MAALMGWLTLAAMDKQDQIFEMSLSAGVNHE
jgi:hypothetical protein